ncbi:MAG TPA: Gfo/Idh/MocA family oxidoreductase, partial [Terriglobia bacterium]|nr:Gfo/Idh/MocA family oxidoreductase [Terriglobia bacterium]
MEKVRIGIVGSAFVSSLHAEALEECPEAQILAVCSPNKSHAEAFAARWHVPNVSTDYRRLLDREDVDAIVIGIPNHLHREVVVTAADAGKHIILEKPMAHTLEDADAMLKACRKRKVMLGYAETICFSP